MPGYYEGAGQDLVHHATRALHRKRNTVRKIGLPSHAASEDDGSQVYLVEWRTAKMTVLTSGLRKVPLLRPVTPLPH